MTLQNALAIYLHFWMMDGPLNDRDEQVVEAAVKLIEQEARKAIVVYSQDHKGQ
ncbi:hypothetical protein [Bradyrhizobium sp. LHD-71]|uniref:hypothetical protein n=1 Tax=Bradyrhizobium sp. LHD-71 TaxID=3072141 RepID=UPI00280D72FB|nr:hypothetical protein [Bradyrhizobium sp. LHD-71]MDQ8728906.1 hypothetical protein [Bradyrhizobium sp. LHD-71]